MTSAPDALQFLLSKGAIGLSEAGGTINRQDYNALPFLRWAGSKRRTVGRLAPLWSDRYRRYVEPFAGSASLFFAVAPESALLSDSNCFLIRTYNAIKSNPAEVFARYHTLERTPQFYYAMRKDAFKTTDDILLAARFLYLNRNCFNGLFRTNKKGEFNVPFSANRVPSSLDEKQFMASAELIKRAEFISADFEEILIDHARTGDFFYIDPPYAVENVRIFTQYGPDNFGFNDLRRLGDALSKLDSAGIDFVVSYADCAEARTVFSQWHIDVHSVTRHISGFAAHRKQAAELVVTNIRSVGSAN